MTQEFDLVAHDLATLQAYLDLKNSENKAVNFMYAPHGNHEFIAMTAHYPSGLQIDQIVNIMDITDIPAIQAWINSVNANDYIVTYIQGRHNTNDTYLLASKTIAI